MHPQPTPGPPPWILQVVAAKAVASSWGLLAPIFCSVLAAQTLLFISVCVSTVNVWEVHPRKALPSTLSGARVMPALGNPGVKNAPCFDAGMCVVSRWFVEKFTSWSVRICIGMLSMLIQGQGTFWH